MVDGMHIFSSRVHLGDSGVGAVGSDDKVELLRVLHSGLGARGVTHEVDPILPAVLVRRYVDRGHQTVDRLGSLHIIQSKSTNQSLSHTERCQQICGKDML